MGGFRKALESWFDAQGMGFLSGINAHQTCSTVRMGSYFFPLRLAVCPSAACSPLRSAQVPHAIGLEGCLSYGSQRNFQGRQSATRHRSFSRTSSARFHQAVASGKLSGNIKGSACATGLSIEPRNGFHRFLALSFAPLPNCQVKGTPTPSSVLPAPNGRPLPL